MAETKDEDVERFVLELQKQIEEDLRRNYSPAVIDHWQNPRNFKTLDTPDGFAQVKGICGDTMEMYLRLKDDTITECTFQTDGCGTTIVCGSATTELAIKKTFTEALVAVNAAEILRILGGLPESSVHCAQLAAETFRRALADYLYRRNAPWTKSYRKT